MLAIYGRPADWNWLLMFHVISALLLVSAALVVTTASLYALRRTTATEATLLLRRLALRTNLFLAIPAFLAVHIFGQVLADREFPKGTESPGWLDTGFLLTDVFGVVAIIILSLLQWWVLRRARSGAVAGWQAQAASWLAPAGLGMLLVVLFVMAGKPGQ